MTEVSALAPEKSGARVLIVDDNAANRDLVATLLGYKGHSSIEASNGDDALALARRELPDLIITDLLMPVMDGYDLIREVREDDKIASTPAIFYTANYLASEVAPIAEALGVHHILSKPLSPHLLLAAVSEALSDQREAPVVVPELFQREHSRAITSKLIDKARGLEEAEDALLASEARFRSLAEFSPVGILAMNRAGEITYANPRLREIWRLGPDDPIKVSRLVHPDDRDRIRTLVSAALGGGSVIDERFRLRVGGEIRWVDFRLAPADDPSGGATLVGTVDDVTDKVEAERLRLETERRLRMSDRLESLGELAAGIAHDFNNVLSLIVSYNQFIEDGLQEALSGGLGDVETTADALRSALSDAESIDRATERASGLTRRLLVFARRDVEAPERLNLNDVLDSALALLSGTIGAWLSLDFKRAGEPVYVMADRTQLEQVIVNLVVNARDALQGGSRGRIEVACERVQVSKTARSELAPGAYAHLSVRDNGPGISPEIASRVFEPFFSTKPPGEGTGLGLSTVYGIVKGLGGAISLHSIPATTGTTFDIYLPLAAVTADA